MTNWPVRITNETTNDDSCRPVYYSEESNETDSSSPLSGPMDSTWPMHGHDVFHTGWSLYSTENNSWIKIWRVRGNKAGEFWGSAIVDNEGSIYFGTKGSDSSVYALYPNGTLK
jgi:hypothetical protein